MNATAWMMVSSAISFLTLLAVLYNSWKDRRHWLQVELHRDDPKVSLVPPPSAPVKLVKRIGTFCKKNWLDILALGWPTLTLVWLLTRDGPVTRWTVFSIAFQVGALWFYLNAKMQSSWGEVISTNTRLIGKAHDTIGMILDIIDASRERISRPPRKRR
jgi:hypothetical protein